MSKFVISEEVMLWWESGKPFSKHERKLMCNKIRSCPLSTELKEEYNRGYNDGKQSSGFDMVAVFKDAENMHRFSRGKR